MNTTVRFSHRGRSVELPALEVGALKVIVRGSLPRIASIHDEHWLEEARLGQPEAVLARLRSAPLKADIFSFCGNLADEGRVWPYPHDTFSLAVAPTHDHKQWWEGLPQETRKHVRKAAKQGVVVREVAFDDALVRGLKAIYDESPVRQGRRFWHYGKPLEQVGLENASFIDRSLLLGAFLQEQLIGFVKLVRVGDTASVMQLISMTQHAGAKINNALLARSVELCQERGVRHLIYGQYVYGKNEGSTLTEFKRRNGFVRVDLPQYHVPLTAVGRWFVATGLHRGWRQYLPAALERQLLEARARWLARRHAVAPPAIAAVTGSASQAP